MTRRYVHLFAVARLVTACSASIYAQQEDLDELRARAEQGDADAQFTLSDLEIRR